MSVSEDVTSGSAVKYPSLPRRVGADSKCPVTQNGRHVTQGVGQVRVIRNGA